MIDGLSLCGSFFRRSAALLLQNPVQDNCQRGDGREERAENLCNECVLGGQFAEGHEFFASTCCILAAAELYPIIMRRPELYITGRIYTLGAHLLLRSCFPLLFPTIMNSAAWFSPDVMYWWGMANGIIGIPFVFWYCYQLSSGKAPVTFRRGKARTAYIEGRANGTIDEYGDPVALPASGSSDGSAAKPPARPDEDAAPVAG